MIRLILAAGVALHGPPEVDCGSVQRMFLGAIASAPRYYEGRVVELCGLVGQRGEFDSRERVLFDVSPTNGDGFALYVFDPQGALPGEGERACVVGASRRRDGLTEREARARGLPNRAVVDATLSDPDYVFYPVPCRPADPPTGELG
jgi:hypothetical protein